jgi:hypothetical protein
MFVINMKKIFDDWLLLSQRRYLPQLVNIAGGANKNFSNVKLAVKPGSVKWTKPKEDNNTGPLKTKVTFNNARRQSQALVQVRVTTDGEDMDRIIIERGVIKGLDNAQVDFRVRSGDIKLDLSNPVCEKLRKKQISQGCEENIESGRRSAVVSCKENKRTDRFQCEVEMTGKIHYGNFLAPREVNVATMVDDLRLANNERVQDLEVNHQGTVVTFTVTGELQTGSQTQPIIGWQ